VTETVKNFTLHFAAAIHTSHSKQFSFMIKKMPQCQRHQGIIFHWDFFIWGGVTLAPQSSIGISLFGKVLPSHLIFTYIILQFSENVNSKFYQHGLLKMKLTRSEP
jgi:hypothetical protein